jgi:hypothetical protein
MTPATEFIIKWFFFSALILFHSLIMVSVIIQELLDAIQSPNRLIGSLTLLGTIVSLSLTIKVC